MVDAWEMMGRLVTDAGLIDEIESEMKGGGLQYGYEVDTGWRVVIPASGENNHYAVIREVFRNHGFPRRAPMSLFARGEFLTALRDEELRGMFRRLIGTLAEKADRLQICLSGRSSAFYATLGVFTFDDQARVNQPQFVDIVGELPWADGDFEDVTNLFRPDNELDDKPAVFRLADEVCDEGWSDCHCKAREWSEPPHRHPLAPGRRYI